MEDRQTLTPKFLTKEMAEGAVEAALEAIFNSPASEMFVHESNQLHIVILVPCMEGTVFNASFPRVLYEVSCGRSIARGKDDFKYPFDKIAHSKAIQLWQGRNDGGTDILPHLLFEGDTPFWGGVKRSGIVVACSGIKPWANRAVSGIIADLLIAMAYEAWKRSSDHADDDLCFVT